MALTPNNYLDVLLLHFRQPEELYDNYGRFIENNLDFQKNLFSLRTLFEKMNINYNFNPKFKFSIERMLEYTLPTLYNSDFRNKLKEQIIIFKQKIGNKIEEYIENVYKKQENEIDKLLNFLYGIEDPTKNTIEAFKQKLYHYKKYLLISAKKFVMNFINSLAFRYLFGIHVLPINFSEQLDSMGVNNERPFEDVDFFNYVLFPGYWQKNTGEMNPSPGEILNVLIKLNDPNDPNILNRFIEKAGNCIIKARIVKKRLEDNEMNANNYGIWEDTLSAVLKFSNESTGEMEEEIDEIVLDKTEEGNFLKDFILYQKSRCNDISEYKNKVNVIIKDGNLEMKPRKQVTSEMMDFERKRVKSVILNYRKKVKEQESKINKKTEENNEMRRIIKELERKLEEKGKLEKEKCLLNKDPKEI